MGFLMYCFWYDNFPIKSLIQHDLKYHGDIVDLLLNQLMYFRIQAKLRVINLSYNWPLNATPTIMFSEVPYTGC